MGLAIVTGGSRGIGAAIAEKLAQDGHDVLINCASSVEKAEAVAEKCRAYGVKAYVKQWDVADYDACAAALKEIKDEIGVPYILVNNAGITRDGLMIRMKEDQFDAVIRTNLKGAFNMVKALYRTWLRNKGTGRIVNVSSVVGLMGNAGQANYAASKAGLIGLMKSVAKEYASRGVTANTVAPGFITTDMTAAMPEAARAAANAAIPMGKPGRPEDVAAAIAFLAGERAGYITGQLLCIDGGMGM